MSQKWFSTPEFKELGSQASPDKLFVKNVNEFIFLQNYRKFVTQHDQIFTNSAIDNMQSSIEKMYNLGSDQKNMTSGDKKTPDSKSGRGFHLFKRNTVASTTSKDKAAIIRAKMTKNPAKP